MPVAVDSYQAEELAFYGLHPDPLRVTLTGGLVLDRVQVVGAKYGSEGCPIVLTVDVDGLTMRVPWVSIQHYESVAP